MMAEGKAEVAMNAALARRKDVNVDGTDTEAEVEIEMWRERLAAAARAKAESNERLTKSSAKCNALMRGLQEEEEEQRGKN